MSHLKALIRFIVITILTLLSLAIVTVTVWSQIGNSRVKADIENLGTKLFMVTSNSIENSDFYWSFAFSFNDKLNFKVKANSLSEVTAKPFIEFAKGKIFRSKNISCIIDPNSTVVISGKEDSISIVYDIVEGNILSKQNNELRKELQCYYDLESQYYNLSKELKSVDELEAKSNLEKFDSIRFYVVPPKRTEWAKKNLDKELAPYYFLQSHINKDTVYNYIELLGENARNSVYGKILIETAKGWKNAVIGNYAPLIIQKDLNYNEFNLENLQGKYVVLDFWGTWCGPCMHGMPKMKEYYTKYKDKFEVVGIACNDKRKDWEKVIEKKELNWTHLLNEESEVNLTSKYGIESYPTKFIIDEKGLIIGKFIGEKEDFYITLDSLFNKNVALQVKKQNIN